jgi:hypothetical protein
MTGKLNLFNDEDPRELLLDLLGIIVIALGGLATYIFIQL